MPARFRPTALAAPLFLLAPLTLLLCLGCVSEGSSVECGAGGRANWEAEDCMTPIGGSCLTLEEFSKDRPKGTQDEIAQIATDYVAYLAERENCDPQATP